MSQPVLRRRGIPRLNTAMPCKSALPDFLIKSRSVPMTPAPVTGPFDRLEQAILQGEMWDMRADPIEIDGFDASRDVISVIVEDGAGPLRFDVKDGQDSVHILANGRPMARIGAQAGKCSLSNIRVLHARG